MKHCGQHNSLHKAYIVVWRLRACCVVQYGSFNKRWWPCRTPLGRLVNEKKTFVRHQHESHFQKFKSGICWHWDVFHNKHWAPVIGCLQFICLIPIMSIAFKWIWLKAPVIECIAFTIRVRCNFSPLSSRMRYISITDCVVCFPTYRTPCTRMLCNIYRIRQLPACK